MPQMTNILVKDDATTPVEFAFVPISDQPIPFWRTSISGVPIEGQMRFQCSSVKQKNGSYKITAKLEVPVMETLGASGTSFGYVAPPKVAYVNTGIFTIFADKRSTFADRANLVRMMAGFALGASATSSTGVSPSSNTGDAMKNSTLPMPLLFTQLIVPN